MADPKITNAGHHGANAKPLEASVARPPKPDRGADKPSQPDTAGRPQREETTGRGPKSQPPQADVRPTRRPADEHRSMLLGDLARRRDHVLRRLDQPGGKKSSERTERDHPDNSRRAAPGREPRADKLKGEHRNDRGDGPGKLRDNPRGEKLRSGEPHDNRAGNALRDAPRVGGNNKSGGRNDPATSAASDLLKHLRDTGRGEKGRALPAEVRRDVEALGRVIGRDNIAGLVDKGGRKLEKFVEHLFRHTGHAAGRSGGGFEPRDVGRRTDELVDAFKLLKHFGRMEKTGGETVRRAEVAAWHLLSHEAGRHEGSYVSRSPRPAELLRDLRSGAFLPAQERHNPFPLTGRARVVSEMMELMRTLDAIESFAQQPGAGEPLAVDGLGLEVPGGLSGDAAFDLAPEELFAPFPALPGRAGRMEIQRFVAALGGLLVDANGLALTTRDGIQLKADQLLWLGVAGGLLGQASDAGQLATRLSPLLAHGFDAVYSLIGFDGRTLAAPHFAAVQSQVNASELEWVFGQPPLTEGWARSLVERLKDSASPDHNLLGEMLEDALADGRFHAVLLQGSVEEGAAAADSFGVARLLPGMSDVPAFAPA